MAGKEAFQSPKIGSVVSNKGLTMSSNELDFVFQSPKIGSVVSNMEIKIKCFWVSNRFNPLKSGQLFQILVRQSRGV